MKRLVFTIVLLFNIIILNAQIEYGFRLESSYNLNKVELKNIRTEQITQEKIMTNYSFRSGMFLRYSLPETYFYGEFSSYWVFTNSFTENSLALRTNRVDLPIYLGIEINHLRFYAGPVYSNVVNVSSYKSNVFYEASMEKKYDWGYHLGFGIDLESMVFDIKLEDAITHIIYDKLPNDNYFITNSNLHLIVSLGFRF